MRKLVFPIAIAALCVGVIAMAADYAETGYSNETTLIESADRDCGSFAMNADGTYENGYAWQYWGIFPPDYGAFVECYSGGNKLCSAVYDLTQDGNQGGQNMNVLVYADAGGTPGAVSFTTSVTPGAIAYWPSFSRHTFAIDTNVDSAWWVGYWGNWPGQLAGWYVGADLDGFGGCPYTNIAPGIGFPTGWNNVSVVWGPTQAIGCGAEFYYGLVPVLETTWGQIKSLYN